MYSSDTFPSRASCESSRELINAETDSVYVFPMCRDDFDKVRIFGQGFDRKLVADEVLTKVI
jgi:CRISPR-associated protein Cas2